MNICIEQDDGLIVAADDAQRIVARRWSGHLLDERCSVDDLYHDGATGEGARLLAWSGSLGGGLFDPSPMNWLTAGRAALDAACTRITDSFGDHNTRMCFQPHVRHVLSDGPSAVNFLDDHAEGCFDVALAPATMLTAGMLDVIEDHLQRQFEMLGPRASMVVLGDVPPADAERDETDQDLLDVVPLGSGVLPQRLVRDLLAEYVDLATPVILTAARSSQQIDWLVG